MKKYKVLFVTFLILGLVTLIGFALIYFSLDRTVVNNKLLVVSAYTIAIIFIYQSKKFYDKSKIE